MGFRKLQTKKMWENFLDERETRTYERYITYELSSFFLNISTIEQEQNREREKSKGQNNS